MIDKNKTSVLLDEIVSVENVGEIETYDLSVPQTHCFFANNLLVHNTGFLEEHADKVLICWYECKRNHVKSNRDFKVIISKNKMGLTGYVDLKFIPEIYKFYEEVEEPLKNHQESWDD